MEKELFNSDNFVLNNWNESNSEKDKILFGKTKIIKLKPKISSCPSCPNLRNKSKIDKVQVAKKLISSDKNEDSGIPVKNEKLSNLSSLLSKNIYLIFYRP